MKIKLNEREITVDSNITLFQLRDLETGAAPSCGLMAPRVGIAAHMQANVVLRLLLGEM